MKIFTILFIFLFFTALGFSIHPDKKWILLDFYFNAGDVRPTVPNSDGVGISRVWTLSEGHIYSDIVYDQTRYPGVWGNCWWDVGKYNYRSSSSSYNEYDRSNTDLRLNPGYSVYDKPVWIGTPQTGQTILQGASKYIDISHFSPACTDYSFTSSGGSVCRVGSVLSVTAPTGDANFLTGTLSGTFKGLKDGVWSDDVPYSFTVLSSAIGRNPIVIKQDGVINPSDHFDSDLGATNFTFKDVATNGQTYSKSSTGSDVSLDSLANGSKVIACAYDSQGNLLQEKVINIIDSPINSAASQVNSSSLSLSSPTTIVSAPNTPISHTVTAKGASNGVIYQLDPKAPSWLSINSKTGVVSGTPPAGTGDYKFDVMTTGYDPVTEKPISNTQTIYGTVSSEPASSVPQNKLIASDTVNNISNVNNAINNQTTVFNSMSELLTSISNNTSSGGGSNADVVSAIESLKDNSGGPGAVDDFSSGVGPADIVIPEPSSIPNKLRDSYVSEVDRIKILAGSSSVKPKWSIPLDSLYESLDPIVIDFNDETLDSIIQKLRAFEAGIIVIMTMIYTWRLIRTFEY